ncbi:hypothetical protein F1K20_18495 [Salmonella enterica subsp. enterica]|uniref:Phage tail protein n=1 Tax=Salmonella enterica TaxID=28901 RepID=A0A745TKI5_SALER|nr:hypothetical protein [Salmonella enterica subsp. enterica serovar Kimuenza]EDP9493073.1 hypothetical protein [Salmonella enterica subsp. enterica]HAF3476302.1 hypothetical protein [Salmonella enterica]ECR5852812.1 hypothetical protein [Salmonella enterica subsp. enterica serovar Kimuenza]ECV5112618.1 hypothetical protein [Salmonella enterica subsp. enterica serovar Kimuenza]
MHRIDTPTAQKDKFGQGKNGFTNGDPATGRRATDLNSDMWDAVQEEVCTVIEAAGIQLSKGEHTQLHAAIGRLIDEQVKTRLEKNQNGADIPNKPLFLQNVGLGETINLAAGALQKSQNGGDIPDKGLFAQNIGAALAFSGGIHIGGDSNPWTTAEFIAWLESCGAFNHPYWMCKGSWDYAGNKVITDTGCGNVCLAGAVVEVMGTGGAITIRVTTPTTTSGGGVASAQFTYINHGDGYAPGWRRDFNTINKPTAGDVGALPVTGGRLNGPLGIGTDNGLGGNSIVLGDNDTGLKQNSDGVLDVYTNNALVARLQPGKLYVVGDVLAGDGRKLSLTSDNNSSLNSRFNLWGNSDRPTVIELDDDQGWQFYSQRNTDGSISFRVNGQMEPNSYSNFDSRYVQDIRLGSLQYVQVWNGPGFSDTSGYVITGITNGNSDELVDGAHRRPIQKLIGNQWYNVVSI